MTRERRKKNALKVRRTAAEVAYRRPHKAHRTNNDETHYADANYAMSFTKGLEHDGKHLLVKNKKNAVKLRAAIDGGYVGVSNTIPRPSSKLHKKRKWESPTAGFVHDLQGPDAQEVTMSPAPALGSEELIYEMAEVYEMALLRDVDFSHFSNLPNQKVSANDKVNTAVDRLNSLLEKVPPGPPKRPRKLEDGKITRQTLFRGSSLDVEVGPYVSQFLLLGSDNELTGKKAEQGYIMYGAQEINQRVPVARQQDYMMDKASYLKVQNGLDVRNNSELFKTNQKRFIQTLRDLATYVHDDALYQAYLNACLILLGQGAPFDPNFDELSGMGRYKDANTGGFALWGGPHILSLLTEVATRALKAVLYQKFNKHLRLRPEALAARIQSRGKFPDTSNFSDLKKHIDKMFEDFDDVGLAAAIQKHTKDQKHPEGTMLLPMAFQEGSPMHPSYGAGHATVAGACVTILKAYFDTSAILLRRGTKILFDHPKKGDKPVYFLPDNKNDKLQKIENKAAKPLTLEGELNKLAANISIARNMAGVHYFSDYYDSLRMGEEVAIGILEEQALTYPKDPFKTSLKKF